MFWRFNLESSGLDTLLTKQDVTLVEVLDEEDVLQECKTPNEKLLDFLTRPDILKELLHLVIDKPSDDVEESIKYKYMNIACEIIILDIDVILDRIANDQEYLDIIWSFTDNLSPLNSLIASFFSKVITMLICRKGRQTFEYLKSHDAVNKLIVHIEISAIMELYIKMVTVVEQSDLKMEICKWLNEEKLIEKLIDYLHPSEDEQKHYYSGQLLSELVRIGRDSISQYIETDDPSETIENPLLLTLENKDTIEKLFSTIFADIDHPNCDSSVVNGITALQSLIDTKRPTIEGMEELITPLDVERIAQGCHTALEVLATRLSDFHDALVRPYHMSAMETTFGILDPPLGKVRLNIASLIASAIATSTFIINEALSKTGTINVLLDLFSRYEWNNFLHTHIQHCIFGILNSEVQATIEDSTTLCTADTLIKHLFQECNIVERCLTLWEANDISEKSGSYRKGYMGHLTKIVNEMKNARELGPNVETIQSMFNEFSDEMRQQWNNLVEGSLEETNKKNICAPMNSWFNPMDSDSEGDDYRPISIPSQYDGTMQQAFENYQVQPMSNEFIETFGYDENSLHENENMKNPFEEVGNIDFTINANEESENEKLYNSICEEKIRPFDDSSDSDEEDMWEEKELTFSCPSQPRESNNAIRSDSDSSSDEENEMKTSSPTNASEIPTKPFSDPFAQQYKEPNEKMEIDSEWTANFDSFGVNTIEDSTWPTPNTSAPTALSTNGENFANFEDIRTIDGSEDVKSSAIEMETEKTKTPYEVKMEERPATDSFEVLQMPGVEGGTDGVAVVEVTQSHATAQPSPPCEVNTATPSPPCEVNTSPPTVQSTSIHVHVESQNKSDKKQYQVTTLDNRLTQQAHSDCEKNERSPTKTTSECSPEKQLNIDIQERTCKNEIQIALSKPTSNDKITTDPHTVESDSVLLNGPPSSEVCVNSSGKLAT